MSKLTPDQIKEEMKKVKIPWFIRFTDKFWFKAGRWKVFIGMLAYIPLGIVYGKVNNYQTADLMWSIMIGWFLFLMFGIGGLMLLGRLVKNMFVKKQAKRLGITTFEWNAYAEEIGLTSF